MEQHLDCDLSREDNTCDGGIWDIWDAPGLRELLEELNPACPFFKVPGNESRLIFSLNMNKQGGKKVLTGGIYIVCLNLPPAIRYNMENMFLVGIIPGPHEPSLYQINYIV